MMVMVSNQSNLTFGYLAGRYPSSVGHLYSPGAQRGPWSWMPYALDNGAWPAHVSGEPWQPAPWRNLLRWAALSGQRPLWALVPDVVGDRSATLARFVEYRDEVEAFGFPLAFAVQDGMTFDDAPDDCVLFLGGSTAWKDAAIGPWCQQFPGRVHVGRVNNIDRLLRCWRAGAISVDGTGWFHRAARSNQLGELCRFIQETR